MESITSMALIEFSSIPVGMAALDRLVKKAPIAFLKSGTVTPGRFLTLFSGSTASVEESFLEGLSFGGDQVWDKVFLPHAHPFLVRALFGEHVSPGSYALLILESTSVCSMVEALDASLKGSEVTLLEFRFADALLHGKGMGILEGPLQEIQAARDIATEVLTQRNSSHNMEIIASPHEGLLNQIRLSTQFFKAEWQNLNGEELK